MMQRDRVPTVSDRVPDTLSVTVSACPSPYKGDTHGTQSLTPLTGCDRVPRQGVGLPPGWMEQDDRRRAETMAAGKRHKAEFTRSHPGGNP